MIIKFLKNNKMFQGTVKTVSDHVVQVNTPYDEEYYEGGFEVYKDDKKVLIGDYSTFIYALNDEGLFSDIEPTEEPPTEPPADTEQPTLKDEVAALKAVVSDLQGDMQSINEVMGG